MEGREATAGEQCTPMHCIGYAQARAQAFSASAYLSDVDKYYNLVQERCSKQELLKNERQTLHAIAVVDSYPRLARDCDATCYHLQ